MKVRSINVFFDGSCGPKNPGGAIGAGAYITVDGAIVHEISHAEPPDDGYSNNYAEYLALKLAMEWLLENGMAKENVCFFGDSNLVIQQVTGAWKVKAGRYKEVAKEVFQLLPYFSSANFYWIPREENTHADALSDCWSHLIP